MNPDKKTAEDSRNVRMVVLNTTDATDAGRRRHVRLPDRGCSRCWCEDQDDLKIGDIAAVSTTRILVGERDSNEGGTHKKVYLIDISGATDVTDKDNVGGGKTVEQASESELMQAGIDYVKKSMAVDLAKLGFRPDKFEGLALIDSTTIAVVNDNDFGVRSIDKSGKVVRSGSPPRLVVIRVPDPLQ